MTYSSSPRFCNFFPRSCNSTLGLAVGRRFPSCRTAAVKESGCLDGIPLPVTLRPEAGGEIPVDGCDVYFFVDNTAAQGVLVKGSGRNAGPNSDRLSAHSHSFWTATARSKARTWLERVISTDNPSDILSRLGWYDTRSKPSRKHYIPVGLVRLVNPFIGRLST